MSLASNIYGLDYCGGYPTLKENVLRGINFLSGFHYEPANVVFVNPADLDGSVPGLTLDEPFVAVLHPTSGIKMRIAATGNEDPRLPRHHIRFMFLPFEDDLTNYVALVGD